MNTSLFIASSGVRAYQGKLDTIANNISNVESTGFKRREATFSDNLTISIQNQTEAQKEMGRLSPLGIRTTFGSRLAATPLDFTQGVPKQTDQPFDFMIEGNGYFQVQRTTGTTTEILYTRGGAFQQSPVGGGRFQLVNAHGDVLLDQNRNPIEWSTDNEFVVASDGTITGTNQQIGLVDFNNPQLLKDDGGVYWLTGGAVTTVASQIKQGFLESSNVDLNQEMTEMIKAQRGYQANARALSYADQMMGIANGIMRS
ncbi:flagellar hook-basal body protein [Bacillus sp. EB106-08-02-XG196]|jgi:flagellar basal-body rod protein FlgG|uniref:flagellar hook-basal body protein n=1 Tax=Bacillus sp. EB106-08-02-XG196 TaxID=2737049 RepID=UPI0015C4AB3D|nr:flagellar hook-basal body protein [Bacillus sp. EB106-08-02-XG196]NWQ39686.1 flagellar hook-basal body protein [Bacillus sp. EB106-08-02-XG196]